MRNARAAIAFAVVALLIISPLRGSAANASQGPDVASCGVAGGTLTMLATDNASEFAAFALYDGKGQELAQQFIPTYNPDASAELMLTPMGFASDVASVKCLADSSIRRCADAQWQPIDEGVGVSITGVLLGLDWAVVSIKGRYVNLASPIAGSIDGANVGFQLDDDPVHWSALYDSQTEASQAFFGIKGGSHTLTVGSRDAASGNLVSRDRLCFNA